MHLTRDEQTIIAQCTPQGSGAIALLRLSGHDVLTVTNSLAELSSTKELSSAASHTIHHGFVVDQHGVRLDEVLFFVMKAPRTFTGQDVVEISTHNNQFIVQSIIDAAIHAGARLAQPGEFSKRAVLNGKMDLLKAEALHEVIHAPTEQALKASLQQMQGSLTSHIARIEQDLVTLLSYSEASFEFLDEEQRDLDFDTDVRTRVASIEKKVANLLSQYAVQDHLRQGIRIALVGAVNTGKSTLFNRLLQQDRSIVTPIEGTTRDVVEAGKHKQGLPWLLVDTAGLRDTQDVVEREGIKRSSEQVERADVVLLIVDSSKKMSKSSLEEYIRLNNCFKEKTLVVASKTDQKDAEWIKSIHKVFPSLLLVSSHTGQGIEQLEDEIKNKIEQLLSTQNTTFMLNKRHYMLLTQVAKGLRELQQHLEGEIQYELLSFKLSQLLEVFSELTGKTLSEKVMDTVFSSFCIGK